MPRPHKCRRVGCQPPALVFTPGNAPAGERETITLRFDELEAIRLADLEGLYHDDAAKQMDVSRPTFGRLVAAARQKVARALVNGAVLTIEGGKYTMTDMRKFVCSACEHEFEVPFGTGRPDVCPACQSNDICRASEGRGGRGRGRGRCGRHGHGHGHGGGGGGRCQRVRGGAAPRIADAGTTQTDTVSPENQE